VPAAGVGEPRLGVERVSCLRLAVESGRGWESDLPDCLGHGGAEKDGGDVRMGTKRGPEGNWVSTAAFGNGLRDVDLMVLSLAMFVVGLRNSTCQALSERRSKITQNKNISMIRPEAVIE
jgi:hypothetical protein